MCQLPIRKLRYCLLWTVFLFISRYASAQTTSQNYVVTFSPRTGITAANTLQTQTVANVNQVVAYLDGLGRPIQTVQTKGSPTQRDLVQVTAYDPYDREAVKYLPYSDTSTSTGYGNFKTTALAAQAAFYANPTAAMWTAPGVVQTPFPTSNTNFEASPLNRVLEQGFDGDNWQLTGTAGAKSPGHTVKIVYACNNSTSLTATTSYWARHYAVQFSMVSGAYNYTNRLIDSGSYAKDVLYLIVTRNENWSSAQTDTTLNTTQEYKDKFGQVVLKRTFNYNTSTSLREVMSTYYIYDEYGRLTYVLPPSANPDSGAVSQRKLDNLCYQYVYDGRSRLIKKKIPGKGWDIMIYNNLNQVIGIQDSTNRMAHPQRVLYNKYDPQGRTIIMGYYTLPITDPSGTNYWSTLQTSANAETTYWETKSSAGVYSNVTIPTSSATALTTNYFDDYNISGLPSTYSVSSGVSVMTRSLPTASITAVLNTPADVLWDVKYYDDLGRDIESYSQHYLGGHSGYSTSNYDLVTSYYNFSNQVDTIMRRHYKGATLKVTVTDIYDYDQVGRKLHTLQQIIGSNGALQTPVYLSLNNYNEVGQLYAKNIGGSTTSGYPANITLASAVTSNQTQTATNSITLNPGFSVASGITFSATIGGYLQTIAYTYNERGWLTTLTPTYGGHYGEQIYYNAPTGSAIKQYNGNIAQFSYNGPKMDSLSHPTAYPSNTYNVVNYTYDNLNRLTQSQSSLTAAASDETVSYDLNGNIKKLIRTGPYTGTRVYTYPGQSNQLTSVQYGTSPLRSYTYDGNGNTTTDSTLLIAYNILNLPDTITKSGTITSKYYYDATGGKLRNLGTLAGTLDYDNGIVYSGGKISYIQNETGRMYLAADSITYNNEYDLKDYLGNVRASYNSNSGTLQYVQENNYYPFGLLGFQYTNGPASPYLYNGKEQQADLASILDYGARFYDPLVARWMEVDPLAEKSRRFSPYNYVEDNPIRNTDPDGMICVGCGTPDQVEQLIQQMDYLKRTIPGAYNYIAGEVGTGGKGKKGGGGKKRPSLKPSPVANRDVTRTFSRNFATPSNFGMPTREYIPPTPQGEIQAYPPPEEVNYNDFGLPTTSLAIGTNVLNTYGAVAGAFEFKAAIWGTDALEVAINGETNATRLGKAMHAAYKFGEADGITTFKEYTGIKGIRPDFVDFSTNTIYELKPNNFRAVTDGLKQLNDYKAAFEEAYPGTTWKTVLSTY